MIMQTEFDFHLPRGYVDGQGQVHRAGRMRLATALDEIESIQDPRVQANEAYLPVILLSRVITRLGGLEGAPPQVVGNLFASDLAYLEDLYLRLNSQDAILLSSVCPNCQARIELQVAPLGLEQEE
jgi:hypothetical protein